METVGQKEANDKAFAAFTKSKKKKKTKTKTNQFKNINNGEKKNSKLKLSSEHI